VRKKLLGRHSSLLANEITCFIIAVIERVFYHVSYKNHYYAAITNVIAKGIKSKTNMHSGKLFHLSQTT